MKEWVRLLIIPGLSLTAVTDVRAETSVGGISLESGGGGGSKKVAPRRLAKGSPARRAASGGRRRAAGGGGGGGKTWGAIAVTIANNGVSSGYAGSRPTAGAAVSDAIAQCSSNGRPGCYTPIKPFHGCAYVSISVNGSDHSAWGTSATQQGAISRCQSNGVNCTFPIGGCSS